MLTDAKSRGGQAPFGFTWSHGELKQVEEEAAVYALLFDLFFIHQRKSTVAKMLNERGLRTRAGNEFKFSTIKRLLNNPIAKGVRRASFSGVNEDGNHVNSVVEESVPPIVSEPIWNHVQAILAEQAGTQTRSPTQDIFIGKVNCTCSGTMELPSKSTEYRCFSCELRISVEDIHITVENLISQLAVPSPDTLDDIARTSLPELKNIPDSLLNEVNRDIEKLFSLHSKEAISDEIFKERHTILNIRKEQLEKTINGSNQVSSFTSFIDQWHALPSNQKRIVVENLIDEIVVSADKTSVSLYPLFNFAQQVTTSLP